MLENKYSEKYMDIKETKGGIEDIT